MKKMKKAMSLALALALMLSVIAMTPVMAEGSVPTDQGYTIVDAAENGNDKYGWKVDGETLYLYYTGKPVIYTSSNYTSRPWQSQISSISAVVIEGTPTVIGNYTFNGMSNLKSFTLAGTETIINACAFAGTGIGGIVTIPKHITKVHGQAFMNCPINVLVYDGDAESPILWLDKGIQYLGKLTNIVIKRKIGFTNLPTADNGRNLKAFGGQYAAGTCGMTNPARINVVSTNAAYFDSFKTITSYPDAYTLNSPKEDNLAPELFKDCSIADPERAITIGSYMDNVWYIDYYTPDGTKELEFVTNGTESGANLASATAFTDNKKGSYDKVTFGFGFTQIPASFANKKFGKLAVLQLPASMQTIGNNAFDGTSTLKKVNFEDTKITSIGPAAFRGCLIKELKFPATISTISMKAFINNNMLECVCFSGSSKLTLGNLAFARENDTKSYKGKNLKVVFDNVTAFNGITDKNTFSADTTSADWRTTTIVYNSEIISSLPNFNKVTLVADKYYEVSDTDNDGKINLFMCNFAEAQSYKLFMAAYSEGALSNVYMLNEGELPAGSVLNTEADASANIVLGSTKIFLWDGFANCKPLTTGVLTK